MNPYFLEQSPPHYQSQPNKKELSKSDSPNARPYENNFYHSFYLKLCLLIFSKNKKCRHIKVLNTPENDDELKKCQLEESNLRPSLYEGDALPAELSWQKRWR